MRNSLRQAVHYMHDVLGGKLQQRVKRSMVLVLAILLDEQYAAAWAGNAKTSVLCVCSS